VSVVQGWVCFFLAVSAFSLIVASLFTRQQIAIAVEKVSEAFLKRPYKIAAVLSLLLPTLVYAQTEHAGGEAN
jgi:hypothetical protein